MSQHMVFARLAKVNEATRQIVGIIASEAPDHANEVFDYDSSKPNFEAWSGEMSKASGGKSVGNVRAMHNKVAAGRLTDISYDDLAKTIEVTADIVDDNEWEKVQKGVYTGFSIGGSYAKKWADPLVKGRKRYTAKPSEVSLVDLGCNPEASFTMVKMDGAEEQVTFHVPDQAELLAKIADAECPQFARQEALQLLAKAHGMNLVITEEEGEGEDLAKGAYSIGELARLADSVRSFLNYDCYNYNLDGTNTPRSFTAELKAAATALYDALLKLVSEDVEAAKAKIKELKKLRDDEDAEPLNKRLVIADAEHEVLVKVFTAIGIEDATLFDAALEKINTVLADNDTLNKSLVTVNTELTSVKEELAKVKKEPAAAKGAVRAVPVSKTDDDGAVLNKDGVTSAENPGEKDPLALVKAAHASGGRQLIGGSFTKVS